MRTFKQALGLMPRFRTANLKDLSHWRPQCSVEWLILMTSIFFALACNGLFWSSALGVQSSLRMGTSVLLFLVGIHSLLLSLVVWRWNAKVLLAVLFVASALATHYMRSFHIYLDSSMLRNVLATDFKESRELLTPALIAPLSQLAVVPIILLWRIRLVGRTWLKATVWRMGLMLFSALMISVGVMLSFQDMSALMRNHREVRYLITPGNYLVGLPKALKGSSITQSAEKKTIGADAVATVRPEGSRPRLLVFVVGETARAQNWGLNGYARETTPQLTQMGVINFSDMHSCGTNTEVSVPCMFSSFGRRNYDEDKIRSHQSLLHVLERAGITTLWRDNQSGCKGVCDGLEYQSLGNAQSSSLCVDGRCFDEILLEDLPAQARKNPGDRVIFLHQLGNHGPSYFQRYPAAYRKFIPTCDTPEMGKCTREQIVNSYDNAILYTDHFLTQVIKKLQGLSDYDTAMIFVSDHGESLGEKGLFLHGMPYAIAPQEQTRVPLVMWFSSTFTQSRGLNIGCLSERARSYANHDALFSSVLGLMQVKTSEYDRNFDFFFGCDDKNI